MYIVIPKIRTRYSAVNIEKSKFVLLLLCFHHWCYLSDIQLALKDVALHLENYFDTLMWTKHFIFLLKFLSSDEEAFLYYVMII